MSDDEAWKTYITDEVAAVCERKGWRWQIRRKWAVRHEPVSTSPVEDHEWKLVVDDWGDADPAARGGFDEGKYYVLGVDRLERKFVLQHDTNHAGVLGRHWNTATFTEIRFATVRDTEVADTFPTEGWLRTFLFDLTAKFAPNVFSIT